MSLPKKNEWGFFEIRMESIGGLGANLAGKMLAEAGILGQGLNGSAFSSYGSEKKGSPVKSFIRFCEQDVPVRINSPIEEPHLLVVFHENLLDTPSVTEGLLPDSTILVNSKKKPSELRDKIKLYSGTIGTLDGMGIAIEEKVKMNTTMLGAIVRASGFIGKDHVKNTIEETLGKKYAALLEANLRAFERGYNEVSFETFEPNPQYPQRKFQRVPPKLGYKNAAIGGIITTPGNSALKDMSGSRSGYIPVLNKANCVNCALCELTCPDFCMVWVEGVNNKGEKVQVLDHIDYKYCKGCLKCVEICKNNALTSAKESETKKN